MPLMRAAGAVPWGAAFLLPRVFRPVRLLLLAVLAVLPASGRAQPLAGDSLRTAAADTSRLPLPDVRPAPLVATSPDSTSPKRAGQAIGEVMLANLVVNRAGSLMGGELKSDMAFSPETWRTNLRLGWVWDEEGFVVNMIGHPVQGSFYHNAGRHNGLSYWESAPLVMLGSWTWEYFGESLRPSLNDFFTTTLSGIAVGEMTYRFAAVVRDNRATGWRRHVREGAAAVLDPIGAAHRIVDGDWTKIGDNPREHDPGVVWTAVEVGTRHVLQDERGRVRDEGLDPGVLLDLGYGDPFADAYRRPFDVFTVRLQLTAGGSGNGLETVQTSGRLYQLPLPTWRRTSRNAFVVAQRFDYTYNPPFNFGGQSVDAGLISRIRLGGAFNLEGHALASGYLFGAISAPDDPTQGGASLTDSTTVYDYGPAFGTVLGLTLTHRGLPIATLRSRTAALHVVSGSPADHFLSLADLKATVPVGRGWGVGVNVGNDARLTRYRTAPSQAWSFTQARVYVSWTSARRSPPVR